jgi:tetratricopeptide (TPR) repeat protein
VASYYFIRKYISSNDVAEVKDNLANRNYADYLPENKELLIEAMRYDNSNADAFLLYAEFLHDEGKYDKALNFYQTAINLRPNGVDGYWYRSQCYSVLKYYKKAIADMSKCIAIKPGEYSYYFGRARLYGFADNRVAAIKDYDEIINRENYAHPKYPSFPLVLNNKASSLIEMGKYYEALPLINRALELDKNDDTLWGTRGELYYAVDDYDKAYNDFSRAIKILEGHKGKGQGDDPSSLYYYRGLIHMRFGLAEAARLDLQKAVQMGSVKAAGPLHQVERIIGKSLLENI